MAANGYFQHNYFDAGYFTPVWFAPADESHVPPELLKGAPDGVAPDNNTRDRYAHLREPDEETKRFEEDRARYAKHIYKPEPVEAIEKQEQADDVSLLGEGDIEPPNIAPPAPNIALAAPNIRSEDQSIAIAKRQKDEEALILLFAEML